MLAGGTGSRLYPLTKVTNKHLLPVGRYPMIYHPIHKLAQAGVQDILVVTGVEHMGAVVGTLGSGAQFGLRFTYRVQDEAGGIAQALALAQDFAMGHRVIVVLGDNVFEADLAPFLLRFRAQASGARVLLKEVADPQRFGVASVQGNRIVTIVEKASQPPSSLAVTGIYMYDTEAFEVIRHLRPSGRGELEITDVNNYYASRGRLEFDLLPGWWTDAGTPESLALANHLSQGLRLSTFEQKAPR